jgi:hypothetical protein
MDLGLVTTIAVGLFVLLAVMFAAFVSLTILEAAFGNFDNLEYDDNDDLFDEEHHVRPLLGVVHPKEK